MLSILGTMIIRPISIIFELIFSISYEYSESAGLSIIILSLLVNLLLLPLFKLSDEIQQEESRMQQKLKPGIDHIRKTFKGDEQYMILRTYYRQNHYSPIYSLRSSISLLLEIPFFIAAYSFLSGLPLLLDSSFLMIENLGVGDGLLNGINVLPILMTLINLASVMVFSAGKPFKDNIQLYLMALLFLILLYRSPSGLVLYWTCNNIFSLFKNIVQKMGSRMPVKENRDHGSYIEADRHLFLIATAILAVLVGLFIPAGVIKASPAEFIDSITLKDPLHYIFNCFLIAAGLFLIWFNVYYSLSRPKAKSILAVVYGALALIAAGNHLLFGGGLGTMSNLLVYDAKPSFTTGKIAMDLLFMAVIVIACFLLSRHLHRICTVVLIALLALSSWDIIGIEKSVRRDIAEKRNNQEEAEAFSIPLAKEGKNVVVIMLDRAISSYFPFLLEEKPELQEQFDGFTYYPNALSYSYHTIFAAPALFGGYEYTPVEINKRADESLRDKHNEALKVLPVLFEDNGYEVTVCDAPLANYSWIPDMSIFEDHPDIRTFATMGSLRVDGFDDIAGLDSLDRNLFIYSLMKASPLSLQELLYDDGYYNNIVADRHLRILTSEFLESYAVLDSFSERTKLIDDSKGTLLILSNETTHSPVVLQEPDYSLSRNPNNVEYDKEHEVRQSIEGKSLTLEHSDQYRHYMCNMAAMLELGEWFDHLRDIGIYDDTRIIIASDHGGTLNQFEELILGEEGTDDIMNYNPLLLVKDFDSKGFEIDQKFMTNADVPYLSVEGLIKDARNPFTGRLIGTEGKEGRQYVSASDLYELYDNEGNVFAPAPWFEVDGDVLDKSAWRKIESLDAE